MTLWIGSPAEEHAHVADQRAAPWVRRDLAAGERPACGRLAARDAVVALAHEVQIVADVDSSARSRASLERRIA